MHMADYPARILEFGTAFGGQYLAWVGAVMFGLDQILSPNFWSKNTLDRLNTKWPAENRHRLFRWLAVAGFVVASFQAFDHVNQELKRVSNDLQTATTNLSTKSTELKGTEYLLTETRRQLAAELRWRPDPAINLPAKVTATPQPRGFSFHDITVENPNGPGIVMEGNLDNMEAYNLKTKTKGGLGIRIDKR
jgi:hypothetical protein